MNKFLILIFIADFVKNQLIISGTMENIYEQHKIEKLKNLNVHMSLSQAKTFESICYTYIHKPMLYLVGPSCTGKSTLLNKLKIKFSVFEIPSFCDIWKIADFNVQKDFLPHSKIVDTTPTGILRFKFSGEAWRIFAEKVLPKDLGEKQIELIFKRYASQLSELGTLSILSDFIKSKLMTDFKMFSYCHIHNLSEYVPLSSYFQSHEMVKMPSYILLLYEPLNELFRRSQFRNMKVLEGSIAIHEMRSPLRVLKDYLDCLEILDGKKRFFFKLNKQNVLDSSLRAFEYFKPNFLDKFPNIYNGYHKSEIEKESQSMERSIRSEVETFFGNKNEVCVGIKEIDKFTHILLEPKFFEHFYLE